MHFFEGKRVLVFSVKTFGYESKIVGKLRELGAIVDWYDDRPDNSFLTKSLLRINRSLLKWKLNNYHNELLRELNGKNYDYIAFIACESFTADFVLKLKSKFKNAKVILYLWDSLENKKGLAKNLEYFDVIKSFDKNDCERYPNFLFRPLFFVDEYSGNQNNDENKYIAAFVGTIHCDRYNFFNEISEKIPGINYSYFYCPSKLLFFIRKIVDRDFRQVPYREVHFAALTSVEVSSIYLASKIVVDVNHVKQVGLTMRTFETMAMNRKLITTNKAIVEYDFYSPKNVCVVDRDNVVISEEFFSSEFVPVPDEILHKYSIEGWLLDVFCFGTNASKL